MKLATRIKTAAAGLAVAPLSVMAAVPVEVTTALDNAKADGVSIATLVVVAIVAIFAFKLMRKAL